MTIDRPEGKKYSKLVTITEMKSTVIVCRGGRKKMPTDKAGMK